MSDPTRMVWSDNPNAPRIPHSAYRWEKSAAAGCIIGSILYGIAITLFFQCMGTLLRPDNRMKKGVRWGLVAHTMAMFSFTSIACVIESRERIISYVDNREFPGVEGEFPPGPYGFLSERHGPTTPIGVLMFPLNQWLADGLLLYRCYIIYSMNYWSVAVPCVMYFATIGTGIAYIYEKSTHTDWSSTSTNVIISYISISLSLNVLLTLMIIIRLALHNRNIQRALGTSTGVRGLYRAIITMLIESYALYAVTLLLYVIPLATSSTVSNIFVDALGGAQVIAPFLIILRVTSGGALKSDMIAPGSIGSMHFRNQGGSTGDETFLDMDSASSTGVNSDTPDELDTGGEKNIEGVP